MVFIGQNKHFEGVTLGLWELVMGHFHCFSDILETKQKVSSQQGMKSQGGTNNIMSHHAQYQDPETEVAKWNSAIINPVIYLQCFFYCDKSKCEKDY